MSQPNYPVPSGGNPAVGADFTNHHGQLPTAPAAAPNGPAHPVVAAQAPIPGEFGSMLSEQTTPLAAKVANLVDAKLPSNLDYSTESTGGMGAHPDQPIVTLPPIKPSIGEYPLSTRTDEPKRSALIFISTASLYIASAIGFVAYWHYWWHAMHMATFAHSSWLIHWVNPRPGSLLSVIMVCVMAVLGVILTATPGVAAYNAWHGDSFARVAGLVSCLTGAIALFFAPWVWVGLGFAALGTIGLLLPGARRYFIAWKLLTDPPREPIDPPQNVEYGPAPRFANATD